MCQPGRLNAVFDRLMTASQHHGFKVDWNVVQLLFRSWKPEALSTTINSASTASLSGITIGDSARNKFGDEGNIDLSTLANYVSEARSLLNDWHPDLQQQDRQGLLQSWNYVYARLDALSAKIAARTVTMQRNDLIRKIINDSFASIDNQTISNDAPTDNDILITHSMDLAESVNPITTSGDSAGTNIQITTSNDPADTDITTTTGGDITYAEEPREVLNQSESPPTNKVPRKRVKTQKPKSVYESQERDAAVAERSNRRRQNETAEKDLTSPISRYGQETVTRSGYHCWGAVSLTGVGPCTRRYNWLANLRRHYIKHHGKKDGSPP